MFIKMGASVVLVIFFLVSYKPVTNQCFPLTLFIALNFLFSNHYPLTAEAKTLTTNLNVSLTTSVTMPLCVTNRLLLCDNMLRKSTG